MQSMFENAVASIRMGVEDSKSQDPLRVLSAVRNFYAGILLLAKERLIRCAPYANPQVVIAAKISLVLDGYGGIVPVADGAASIDYNQIKSRFKAFNLLIDSKVLDRLGKIRNDIEHKNSKHPEVAIRDAITSTFVIAISLFRQIGEDPIKLLGDAWYMMLETKKVYDAELERARGTLSAVKWYSNQIDKTDFECPECQSSLVAQSDETNTIQAEVKFRCCSCSATLDVADMIEDAIERKFGAEVHIRALDEGIEGPIYECPECGRSCLLETGASCANCNAELNYNNTCHVCDEHISISDYLDSGNDGLCSYHAYQFDKVMSE